MRLKLILIGYEPPNDLVESLATSHPAQSSATLEVTIRGRSRICQGEGHKQAKFVIGGEPDSLVS